MRTGGIFPGGRSSLRRPIAWALWGAASLFAAVLLWRALAGGFVRGVPVFAACAGTAAVYLVCLAACAIRGQSEQRPDRREIFGSSVATLLPPLLTSILLIPAGSTAGVATATVLFIAATLAAVSLLETASENGATFNAVGTSPLDGAGDPPAAPFVAGADIQSDGVAADRANPRHLSSTGGSAVSQWMSRSTSPEGDDVLEGSVVVQFEADQKQATAHLSFCPAFCEPPEVECEPLDDASVRLKIAAVYSYGARIDVRRSQGGPARVELGFTARAAAASGAA